MKLKRTENKIIAEFPAKRDRIDPYEPDRDAGRTRTWWAGLKIIRKLDLFSQFVIIG